MISYTGVLLAGTTLSTITNVVAQSSASTAISLGGPSQYSPPGTPAPICSIEPVNNWLAYCLEASEGNSLGRFRGKVRSIDKRHY